MANIDGVDLISPQVDVEGRNAHPGLAMADRTGTYLGAEGMVRMARDIAALDLVITVDTYVAYLAGALAVETWVLLPHGPEWRWGVDGARTPWYPRARLFRQVRGLAIGIGFGGDRAASQARGPPDPPNESRYR